jgi:hypothetical protein
MLNNPCTVRVRKDLKEGYMAAVAIVIVLAVGAIVLSGITSASRSPENIQNSTAILSIPSVFTISTSTGSARYLSFGSASGGSRATFLTLATDPHLAASVVSKFYLHYGGEDVHGTAAATRGLVRLNFRGHHLTHLGQHEAGPSVPVKGRR